MSVSTFAPARLAFTGTRKGLTPRQRDTLRTILAQYDEWTSLHNGCAEGADAECLDVRDGLAMLQVHLWPCNEARRAWALQWGESTDYWQIHDTLPPLERNRRMVDAATLLIACPHGPEEQRSGTWSTVRYARKIGRAVCIVWPDGSVS